MPRFNFNNITLQSKADISKVMENFNKIEENARTATEIQSMIDTSASPKNHASSQDTYGLAGASSYGHTKVIDNLNASTYANGEALSAHQGNVLNTAITTLDTSLGGLAKRNYSFGTAAPSGGNNGDIYDQYYN